MKFIYSYIFCISFIFLGCKKVTIPVGVTTSYLTIDSTDVKFIGTIERNGGAEIEEQGFCWSFSDLPTILDNKIIIKGSETSFSYIFKGFEFGKKYYFRTFATNSKGTIYGNIQSFKLIVPIKFNSSMLYGSVTDNEGNVYKTIKIGDQTWMAENLKTSHYNNGDLINLYNSLSKDSLFQMPSNNDENNVSIYGRYYSFLVLTDTRGICPIGWHIPSSNEWKKLIDYCGGQNTSTILKLSEVGNLHWFKSIGVNSNLYGFTALPSGYFEIYGGKAGFNSECIWWTNSTSTYGATTYCSSIQFKQSLDYIGTNNKNAYSVRLIKD